MDILTGIDKKVSICICMNIILLRLPSCVLLRNKVEYALFLSYTMKDYLIKQSKSSCNMIYTTLIYHTVVNNRPISAINNVS